MSQVIVGLERYQAVHRDICRSGLTWRTEGVAHRLLAMADLSNGQINMTWEELAELTGCENVNAARRHLTRLQAVGLIHYSTNDYVYVTFLEWMEDGKQRAAVARGRAGIGAPARRLTEAEADAELLFGEADAPPPARGDTGLREGAPAAARGRVGHSHARLLVSQSVDPIQHRGGNRLTDRLSALPRIGVALDEQRRSVALLTDAEVGLDAGMAWALAQRWHFAELARQVMTWRRQLRSGLVADNGALVHRVVEGWGAMITDEDKRSGLYCRHHSRAEREERVSYSEAYRDLVEH